MTTNQTIDGVMISRELLEVVAGFVSSQADAFPLINVPRGLRSEALDQVVRELRALLDAPADVPADRCGVQMADCPECSHQWDHFFECGNKPAAQPRGEPVAIDRISVQMLKGGLFRLDSDPDGPLVRYQDHAEQVESLRLEVGRLNRVKLALAEKVTVHADNCAAYRAQLAEQPAPVAVVPTYKPGLYAVRHIDNWDGERDVALTFAMLDADGNWTDNESGAPLLTYQGDKILRAWPLDCSEAPDTQIIGVPRNWLEDWALELVEAAQDGGTMSNQVEHLLQLHPKQ